jgi:hypothetical protein
MCKALLHGLREGNYFACVWWRFNCRLCYRPASIYVMYLSMRSRCSPTAPHLLSLQHQLALHSPRRCDCYSRGVRSNLGWDNGFSWFSSIPPCKWCENYIKVGRLRYPLDRRLGGYQNWSGRHEEEKILDSTGTRNSDPSVVQPVSIPTALSNPVLIMGLNVRIPLNGKQAP